jgi:hypothetical protein
MTVVGQQQSQSYDCTAPRVPDPLLFVTAHDDQAYSAQFIQGTSPTQPLKELAAVHGGRRSM